MEEKLKYQSFVFLFVSILMLGCFKNSPEVKSEGYVTVEGGKIWYKIMGEEDRTPILLVHGGPGGTHKSFHALKSLSEERSLIFFDQLGTGKSGYHEDTTLLTVNHLVEQVKVLKDALALKEFYLLGHSWGAALELAYYLKYPEGVKGIIFSSPYLGTEIWIADADTLVMTLPDSIQSMISTAENNNEFDSPDFKFADSVYWSLFGLRSGKLPEYIDTITAPGNTFIYNYMWGPSEFTATGVLKNYDNIAGLEKVKVPVMFITGEYDEARPSTVEQFHKKIPGSKFIVVENAGHSSMVDNREQYCNAVDAFLKEIEAPQ